MKKVVYSVQRAGRFDTPKMSGLGYIVEDNLLISAISQKGKPLGNDTWSYQQR